MNTFLENAEQTAFDLRILYEKYGYSRYKMSKFEEYDLYVRNKDFLVSDNVITFNDTDGRLMALKPDVTLSIINNLDIQGKSTQKVYYNENVYRVSKGTNSFKEIMQVGLECMGQVDDYCISEVITLAARSLDAVSNEFVLDISHQGILKSVLDNLGIEEEYKTDVIKFIEEKNANGIETVLSAAGKDSTLIKKLISTYGSCDRVFPLLDEITTEENKDIIDNFKYIVKSIENAGFKNKISIDFSLVSDMNYYNGFVFKGFISGIASAVLSGGQYDKLMKKMNKGCSAIGFAVYVDMLSRYNKPAKASDVDIVVLYDDKVDITTIQKTVKTFCDMGKTVFAAKEKPEHITWDKLYEIVGEEAKHIE